MHTTTAPAAAYEGFKPAFGASREAITAVKPIATTTISAKTVTVSVLKDPPVD